MVCVLIVVAVVVPLVQNDGDNIVLNGRKWWTSGAMDPRCKVAIFMGRQMDAIEAGAPRHAQHSMVLVPMDAPGVEVRQRCSLLAVHTAGVGMATPHTP